MAILKNCFAYKNVSGKHHCNALKEIDCYKCKFFAKRSQIVNNPFYKYSYKNKDKWAEDVKKHKINIEEVVD